MTAGGPVLTEDPFRRLATYGDAEQVEAVRTDGTFLPYQTSEARVFAAGAVSSVHALPAGEIPG